ncbi:MAG: cyclic nucleotide-binding domain-containing protein [Verrucomicrobiota bacterium]
MPLSPDPELTPLVRDDEDEGLFSRDINGQLVRLDSPTEDDYDKTVTLQIDGRSITVPLAEPLQDANGNIVLDLDGRTRPRYTTIYDAAVELYVSETGDESKIPIPTLCHQPHMTPVAVCRLCVVQIYGQKRGQRTPERKLLPACQHQVKDGMEVFTMESPGADGERVRQAVRSITELLASDSLKPAPQGEVESELASYNELGLMAKRCGADPTRLRHEALQPVALDAKSPRLKRDVSSPVFVTDHSACILCDRCVRACNDVKHNNVIGRTGKGANAAIGFDLNEPMGQSDCVQCGECMVSCPTTAITFKPLAPVKMVSREGVVERLSAAELLRDPLFSGVPPKFLLWQEGLVTRRKLKAGQMLVLQGEPGNTAFIIKSGVLQATVYRSLKTQGTGWLGARRSEIILQRALSADDLIVGEMSCLSGTPRTADLKAKEDSEVWEVRRNLLDRLMRLPSLRERLEEKYRERSLDLVLQTSNMFDGLTREEYERAIEYLRPKITFVRVNPGQVLFEQGDPADCLYIVRLGYVRIGVRRYKEESRVQSSGPGSIIGEIGLLGLSMEDARRTADQVEQAIVDRLKWVGVDLVDALPMGKRTASCSALGHLELARLSREDFLPMLRDFPTLRRHLVDHALNLLKSDYEPHPTLTHFVEQGLYEGRSVLALDLDLCTRCDECVKGCVEQHGESSHGTPVTRVLRDGQRLGKFLVATSCRSCVEAHCMVGCPVDSIHRGKHLQIVIEDHCIGCGLCASNCPYGSIFMVPNQNRLIEVPHAKKPGQMVRVAQPKAVACDLCDSAGELDTPEPRCVSACPHDAAARYTGDELLGRVLLGERPKA